MRTDRIHLTYDLAFQAPFHCGTGLRAGLLDRTIVRDHNGKLYVPGSTIKGNVREQCELLARLYEELDEERKMIASPHDEKIALLALGRPRTMITRIFGSHNTPGLLNFNDARQEESPERRERKQSLSPQEREEELQRDKLSDIQTEVYTQARLDRLTRTAVEGALYTSEFGGKGNLFKGSITGWLECLEVEEGGATYSLLLLLAGLHMVERLGANKSVGRGRCTCTVTGLRVNGQVYEQAQWQGWLDKLEMLSYYSVAE